MKDKICSNATHKVQGVELGKAEALKVSNTAVSVILCQIEKLKGYVQELTPAQARYFSLALHTITRTLSTIKEGGVR